MTLGRDVWRGRRSLGLGEPCDRRPRSSAALSYLTRAMCLNTAKMRVATEGWQSRTEGAGAPTGVVVDGRDVPVRHTQAISPREAENQPVRLVPVRAHDGDDNGAEAVVPSGRTPAYEERGISRIAKPAAGHDIPVRLASKDRYGACPPWRAASDLWGDMYRANSGDNAVDNLGIPPVSTAGGCK
jgi:hypothetical protein